MLSSRAAGLGFPPCGDIALTLPVGAALPSHCIPTPHPALPGKQAPLPLSHPRGSLILPPGAGFPEQGHCGSHWSPAANKTHPCGERAHKTSHPERVCVLCHPHPTQGWDQDLQAVWCLCGPHSCPQHGLGEEGNSQAGLCPLAYQGQVHWLPGFTLLLGQPCPT